MQSTNDLDPLRRAADRQLTLQLHRYLQEQLPAHMVPAAIVLVSELPLTPNGKVDRRALPAVDVRRPVLAASFAPPTTPLEKTLARLFADVLRVEQIGINDNFFSLGGHSLLAAQMASRVGRAFKVQVPLRVIFDHPTVAGLAAVLAQDLTSATLPKPLLMLQKGGAKRPFFFVHPLGGSVGCYLDLARALEDDRPFYGLQTPGLDDGETRYRPVEEMAGVYVEAIRSVQPEGPYQLGGWSMGGVVAYEMAHQLLAQGQSVALLALIDSDVPQPGPGLDSDLDHVLLAFGRYYELQIDPADYRQQEPADRLAFIAERMKRAQLILPDAGPAQVQAYLDAFWNNSCAYMAYVPRVYPGSMVVFRAADEPRQGVGDDLGWRALTAGPLTTYVLPGNHRTLIQMPYVATLAERLKAHLADAS